MWRDSQPLWTSQNGRVMQVRDAAYTFIPSSGYWRLQAIEDAASLATCLQIGRKEDVNWAVIVHNKFVSTAYLAASYLDL
jgi:hypothetical protein